MFHKLIIKKMLLPASSSAMLTFTVLAAKSGSEDQEEKKDLIRPSDLPIYSEPSEKTDPEKKRQEDCEKKENQGPMMLHSLVKQVREGVWSVADQLKKVKDEVDHIYETGKAHTSTAVETLREEENFKYRVGAITGGGILGYILALRRGWFRRILNTAAGATAVAAICYPKEAKEYGSEAYQQAKKVIVISYHFVNGDYQRKQGSNGEQNEPCTDKKPSKKSKKCPPIQRCESHSNVKPSPEDHPETNPDKKPKPEDHNEAKPKPASYVLTDLKNPVLDSSSEDYSTFYTRRG